MVLWTINNTMYITGHLTKVSHTIRWMRETILEPVVQLSNRRHYTNNIWHRFKHLNLFPFFPLFIVFILWKLNTLLRVNIISKLLFTTDRIRPILHLTRHTMTINVLNRSRTRKLAPRANLRKNNEMVILHTLQKRVLLNFDPPQLGKMAKNTRINHKPIHGPVQLISSNIQILQKLALFQILKRVCRNIVLEQIQHSKIGHITQIRDLTQTVKRKIQLNQVGHFPRPLIQGRMITVTAHILYQITRAQDTFNS
mmetsp:Transcript_9344/g.15221  ORF Transcript_9344/g.15221 Transcript_9344/m.15221 type:complete len:254 (+) Transcript_9344:4788-5549(+)